METANAALRSPSWNTCSAPACLTGSKKSWFSIAEPLAAEKRTEITPLAWGPVRVSVTRAVAPASSRML